MQAEAASVTPNSTSTNFQATLSVNKIQNPARVPIETYRPPLQDIFSVSSLQYFIIS